MFHLNQEPLDSRGDSPDSQKTCFKASGLLSCALVIVSRAPLQMHEDVKCLELGFSFEYHKARRLAMERITSKSSVLFRRRYIGEIKMRGDSYNTV